MIRLNISAKLQFIKLKLQTVFKRYACGPELNSGYVKCPKIYKKPQLDIDRTKEKKHLLDI